MRRAGLWALLLVIGGCKDASGPPAGGSGAPGAMGKAAQSFPVEVTTVASRTLGFSGRAVGTLEPFERVQVTARVAGAVDAVRFREGDRVSRGDVLVEVDTARFALVARSAKARVDRARAALYEQLNPAALQTTLKSALADTLPVAP
jgi:multidrug efflux system membrane fusion protein